MKLRKYFVIVPLLIMAAILLVFSQSGKNIAVRAKDFPPDALVYAQTEDFPALFRLWNESKFKGRYLESKNFADFQKSHLGLKLANRWQEFSSAAGFPLDPGTIAKFTMPSGAIALYDIGKLEFVFIAPLSDEVFATSLFMQNKDKFTEQTLDDGTVIYRTKIDADRGRQKQELIFTHSEERFILATSEKLLVQTLSNIDGKTNEKSLANNPAFKSLSEKFAVRAGSKGLLTVWTNQATLNRDYYFKRYWLMSDVKDLENVRAGIFDFRSAEGKLIERREFLLARPVETPLIAPSSAQSVLALLPPEAESDGIAGDADNKENQSKAKVKIPFYKLQTAIGQNLNSAVSETIFGESAADENSPIEAKNRRRSRRYYYDHNDFDAGHKGDYSILGEEFDQAVNDSDEQDGNDDKDRRSQSKDSQSVDFSDIMKRAAPQAVLTFTVPRALPKPQFADFGRGAIFNLSVAENFDRAAFEKEIAREFARRVMVSGEPIQFKWETKIENNSFWRELVLSQIGWSAAYSVIGDNLILTNTPKFLIEIIGASKNIKTEAPQKALIRNPVSELTVINFANVRSSYNQIFAQLSEYENREKVNQSDEFLFGNVSSLLNSLDRVKTITIKKKYRQNLLTDEITFDY